MATEKVLWVVNLSDSGVHLAGLLIKAKALGATAVAIRTTATNFDESIPAFHDSNIKVLGWRWPSVNRPKALAQAQHVVELMNIGLDGFIADPEGDNRSDINWDQTGLDNLAQDFCSTIRTAFPNKLFGTTSHYRAKRLFNNLPWQVFIQHSDKVYPQTYWRVQTDKGPKPVGSGQPKQNYAVGLSAWQEIGAAPSAIIPMAGEIALALPEEIKAYAAAAAENHVNELHFYTMDQPIPKLVSEAIAAA